MFYIKYKHIKYVYKPYYLPKQDPMKIESRMPHLRFLYCPEMEQYWNINYQSHMKKHSSFSLSRARETEDISNTTTTYILRDAR